MRTALFWVVTQSIAAISYKRYGKTYRSRLQRSINLRMKRFFFDVLTFEMWLIGCPETSVSNSHYTLRNIPEQRRSEVVYVEGELNVLRNLTAWGLGTCVLIRRNCCVFVQDRSDLKFED
jgi:hypothetical protein